MGPTTVALLHFFLADQAFREASRTLEAATRDVRTQEARVNQLKAEHDAIHRKAMESESKGKELELELKAREERIEMLRERQTNATDDKAYRALIVDINNLKTDKGKLEEQGLASMEQLDGLRKSEADLKSRHENENAKLAKMRAEVGDKVARLTAEVEAARGPRDAAQAAVPVMAMSVYQRAAGRYDGEAMAAIDKPDARDTEYLCTGCNTYLVANIYNRLMSSKDEVVTCPSCGRVLFVPEELTPEKALSVKLAKAPAKAKVKAAPKLDADGNPIKRVSKPRAKKEKVAAGPAPEPGSVAAAIAAGSGAASGKGFAATAPTAPSAPPSTRADGSVIVHEDEPAASQQEAEEPASSDEPTNA